MTRSKFQLRSRSNWNGSSCNTKLHWQSLTIHLQCKYQCLTIWNMFWIMILNIPCYFWLIELGAFNLLISSLSKNKINTKQCRIFLLHKCKVMNVNLLPPLWPIIVPFTSSLKLAVTWSIYSKKEILKDFSPRKLLFS